MKIVKVNYWCEVSPSFSGIVEHANGSKYWLLNGRLHRPDGPAQEHLDGSKTWWLNGLQHRTTGPACMLPDGSEEYYIYGQRIENETAFNLLTNLLKLKNLQ